MEITNSNDQATSNFIISEFFHAANPSQVYNSPDSLVQAAQVLRTWFGKPITITSTYRPYDTFGFHRTAQAIDFAAYYVSDRQPLIDKYNSELMNYIQGKKSDLISNLRKVGITGFGMENVCVHLDCRPLSYCNRTDEYGKYMGFKFSCHYDQNGTMIIDENFAL